MKFLEKFAAEVACYKAEKLTGKPHHIVCHTESRGLGRYMTYWTIAKGVRGWQHTWEYDRFLKIGENY